MAKQGKQVSFTFVNPNTTTEFERQFRRILIERLIAVHRQNVRSNIKDMGWLQEKRDQ